jgi:hypothetical protein
MSLLVVYCLVGIRVRMLLSISSRALWSERSLGQDWIEKSVLVVLLREILSTAVDEWFVILVGKSTVLKRLYEANRESNWSLLLLVSR